MKHEPVAPAADPVAARIAEQIIRHLQAEPLTATPWRTPEDAASYLSLTLRGLEDMRAKGTGPRFSKVGRIVRYNVADLDLWLLTNGGGDA